jgi:hypothetical protein
MLFQSTYHSHHRAGMFLHKFSRAQYICLFFKRKTLVSCKLTAHICLWTFPPQNDEDAATKALKAQINASTEQHDAELLLNLQSTQKQEVQGDESKIKRRGMIKSKGVGSQGKYGFEAECGHAKLAKVQGCKASCGVARDLAEVYLQLRNEMKIWLTGFKAHPARKDYAGK